MRKKTCSLRASYPVSHRLSHTPLSHELGALPFEGRLWVKDLMFLVQSGISMSSFISASIVCSRTIQQLLLCHVNLLAISNNFLSNKTYTPSDASSAEENNVFHSGWTPVHLKGKPKLGHAHSNCLRVAIYFFGGEKKGEIRQSKRSGFIGVQVLMSQDVPTDR